jgi:hypothetical protein
MLEKLTNSLTGNQILVVLDAIILTLMKGLKDLSSSFLFSLLGYTPRKFLK